MTTPRRPSRTTDLCHCGHAEDYHDAVAVRYCEVTLHEALSRTCACPLGPNVPWGSYARR